MQLKYNGIATSEENKLIQLNNACFDLNVNFVEKLLKKFYFSDEKAVKSLYKLVESTKVSDKDKKDQSDIFKFLVDKIDKKNQTYILELIILSVKHNNLHLFENIFKEFDKKLVISLLYVFTQNKPQIKNIKNNVISCSEREAFIKNNETAISLIVNNYSNKDLKYAIDFFKSLYTEKTVSAVYNEIASVQSKKVQMKMQESIEKIGTVKTRKI